MFSQAGSGEEALYFWSRTPEVILMDLSLPTCTERKTRSGQGRRQNRRIFQLWRSQRSLQQMMVLAAPGPDAHLKKPISIADFPHQVRRYCGPGRAPRGQPPVEQ